MLRQIPLPQCGSADHGFSQAYITGVTGTLSSINGEALTVNSYGGSVGAWTVNVAFNSAGPDLQRRWHDL